MFVFDCIFNNGLFNDTQSVVHSDIYLQESLVINLHLLELMIEHLSPNMLVI